MLRRPFSLAGRRDVAGGVELDIIHRVVGVGTQWLSALSPGDHVDILGPLGNTFTLPPADGAALLVGGGVGIPPMLYLASQLSAGAARSLFPGAVPRFVAADNHQRSRCIRSNRPAAEYRRVCQAWHPDPTMRVNALSSLSDPPVILAVRNAPLVASRAVGRFSFKDVEIASGDAPPPAGGPEPTPMATIEAVLTDCDLATLQETTAAVQACVTALAGVEAAVGAQVDAASTPNFGKLAALIKKAANFLQARLAQRTGGAQDGAESAGGGAEAGGGGRPGGNRSSRPGKSGRARTSRRTRQDCAYYTRHEPSSPIPLFMERCKRLVTMSFIDIVRELVPDAIAAGRGADRAPVGMIDTQMGQSSFIS